MYAGVPIHRSAKTSPPIDSRRYFVRSSCAATKACACLVILAYASRSDIRKASRPRDQIFASSQRGLYMTYLRASFTRRALRQSEEKFLKPRLFN
jgi:hypothetical protein